MAWCISGGTSPMAAHAIRKFHKAHPDEFLVLLIRKPDAVAAGLLPPASKKVEYLQTDMADLDSVRAAVTSIAERVRTGALPRLSGIVLAASIQLTVNTPKLTRHGEETIVVNHLSNFLIIAGLIASSMDVERGKIIVVGSDIHRDGYKYLKKKTAYVALPELLHPPAGLRDPSTPVEGRFRYAVSKLYQTATAHELARRLKASRAYNKLRVVLWEPGSMGTGLYRDRPAYERLPLRWALNQYRLLNWIDSGLNASTPARSGDTLARIMLEDSFADSPPMGVQAEQGGAPYFGPSGSQKATEGSVNDLTKCEAIWKDTLKELNIGGDVNSL